MRSECVDLLDADEHAMARAVVREAGAIGGGVDGPALRFIGSVVDADGGDGAQIAQHPLHGAAGGDVDAVGVLTISQGELVNGASQPTLSLLIWQRVIPDLVSMKT